MPQEYVRHREESGGGGSEFIAKWAERVAEEDLVLPRAITFEERPLVMVTTARIGDTVRRYLDEMRLASTWMAGTGYYVTKDGPGRWEAYPPEWWAGVYHDTLVSLMSLKDAVDAGGQPRLM